MSEAARGPMPFTELLDVVVVLGRRHFKSVVLPIGVPMCLVSAALPVGQAIWTSALVRSGASHNLAALFGGMAAFLVLVGLYMVVQTLGYVATVVMACAVLQGRSLSASEAWMFALRPRVLGTLALSLLAWLVGTMFCVFPGIYVWIVFSMAVPVMMLESTFGPDALRRSFDLTSYNPRGTFTADPRVKVFVLVLVGYLVGYALSFAAHLPMLAVQQILMLRMMSSADGADPSRTAEVLSKLLWIQVPTTMVSAFTQFLMFLYISFGLALLYLDLKHRREGSDLESAIAEMDARPPDAGM